MVKKIYFLFLTVFLFLCSNTLEAQSETLRDSVIRFASNYLKTPYKRGGITPNAFDCSGFSSFIYKNFGYQLYRTSSEQAKNGVETDKLSLKPGDLVLFKGRNAKAKRIGHVGIVVESDEDGRFKFIHASVKNGVKISSGEQAYYKQRYVTARRIVEDDPVEVPDLAPLLPKPVQLKIDRPFSVASFLYGEKIMTGNSLMS